MNKQFVAAFTMLYGCFAYAQSNVAIFGVVDAGIAHLRASGGAHATGLVNGGSSTSRLGFRGVEDLGGGFAASFWLESQLSNDVGGGTSQTGGLDFVRRSTLSLSGDFGEFRLGRDFTPSYLTMNDFDSFGQRGLGAIENAGPIRAGVGSYVRVSNSVSYLTPATLNGFFAQAQYAFGEQASNKSVVSTPFGTSSSALNATSDKTGSYYGVRLGYINGPVNLSGALGVFQDAIRSTQAQFYAGDYKIANIGASYDFGFIRPRFLYQSEKIDGQGALTSFKFETIAVGATAPFGAGLVRTQLSHYSQNLTTSTFNKFSLGYIYNLSKRTTVYADINRINNKGLGTFALNNLGGSVISPTPIAGGKSTGYAVGIKTTF
jgi:predicted porin